ncbi:MAG: phosphoenolpyruvate carboxylase [Candidatus Melainabacteria bacterium]|jgi:phosphoenolpyruvate carboxylase
MVKEFAELNKEEGLENIKFRLFFCRGYSIARSGYDIEEQSKIYLAESESESPTHQTVQGMRQGQYYTPESAAYYTAKAWAASMDAILHPEKINVLSCEDQELLNKFIDSVKAKVSTFVKSEDFIKYFKEAAPYEYYEHFFGSRPKQHNARNKAGINSLRAIESVEIPSLIAQQILMFYGVGSAVNELNPEERTKLITLYPQSDFLNHAVGCIKQGLSSTNMDITSYLRGNPEHSGVWNQIKSEFELTDKWVREISGLSESESLLDDANQQESNNNWDLAMPAIGLQQYAIAIDKTLENAQSTLDFLFQGEPKNLREWEFMNQMKTKIIKLIQTHQNSLEILGEGWEEWRKTARYLTTTITNAFSKS